MKRQYYIDRNTLNIKREIIFKLDRRKTLSFTLTSINIQSHFISPIFSKESNYIYKTMNTADRSSEGVTLDVSIL